MTRLPVGWQILTIGEITAEMNPGFASGEHNQEGRGVPHLRPMNISHEGDISLSTLKYVDVDEYDALRSGDVLFNNTNSPALVGKTSYIRQDSDWAYSNHMTRLRLRPGYHAGWVAYALHHLFFTGYFQLHCRHHVNQASINTTFLAESVSIPVPPSPNKTASSTPSKRSSRASTPQSRR